MLQKLPVRAPDDNNQWRRHREITNQILDHSFDDSRVQTPAEKIAGVAVINGAYAPGDRRRYGAACDGVTDDTVALNNAATAVRTALIAANQGGPWVLTFGGGTSLVSSTIDLSGTAVDGGGFNLSGVPHIQATSAQFNVITSSGRTIIQNLFVDGGWDGSTTGLSGDTFSFIDPIDGTAYDIYLSNVGIFRSKKRGIYWEGGAYGFVDRPQISGCGLHAVELFSVDAGHTTTTIGFTGKGTMSSTPNGYGMKITSCVSISVDTIIMEATKGILVAGSGNRTLSFDRVYQESPVSTTFLDLGASDGIGLSVTNCFGNGLHITEATNWVNPHFDSNTLTESSIYADGRRWAESDSGEVLTAITGGTNFTACSMVLGPGTWQIDSTMQVQDAGGAAIVKAGIKITGTVGDSGLNINTNVNFTVGCDEATSFGASQDARLHAEQVYQNSTGANVTIYLRGFINISAGTIAYRAYSSAVKMQ